jgi:hypothetical protein
VVVVSGTKRKRYIMEGREKERLDLQYFKVELGLLCSFLPLSGKQWQGFCCTPVATRECRKY